MDRPAAAGMVTRHTAELTAAELGEVRALCEAAFDDFGEEDWQHALGGMHALVRDGDGVLVAHGSLGQRLLRIAGRWLRCGWVESVAVRPDRRREGHGHAVMVALESLAPAYDLLGLCSSDEGRPLYEARGWTRWRGTSAALTPDGIAPTPDEDSIYVLAPASLDVEGTIVCDWRVGDVW